MKFTAHIGLGKTGTSAIQKSLQSYKGSLNTAENWGWPDLANGKKIDFEWLESSHSTEKTKELFDIIVNHSKKTGCDHVVWSNEAISSSPEMVQLFKELLDWSPDLDVQIILYIREPGRWLKSAWEQWGLIDKVLSGRVHAKYNSKPVTFQNWFRDWGRGNYNNWKKWKNISDIRRYKEGENIIDDFCEATRLDLPRLRTYESAETSEVLSRAIYNNTYSCAVTPHKFDFYTTYGTVDEYSKKYFSLSNIEKYSQILKDESCPFEELERPKERKITEEDYSRLLDQAIIFSIQAIGRIDQLEDKVKELSNKLDDNT